MSAEAIVTRQDSLTSPAIVYVMLTCSECGLVTYTSERKDYPADWPKWGHLRQHDPGRALDIEVSREPVAECSVCADGIGDIVQDDDGLACRECGTRWDMGGTNGERES